MLSKKSLSFEKTRFMDLICSDERYNNFELHLIQRLQSFVNFSHMNLHDINFTRFYHKILPGSTFIESSNFEVKLVSEHELSVQTSLMESKSLCLQRQQIVLLADDELFDRILIVALSISNTDYYDHSNSSVIIS
jgi:hypothetical protein